MNLLCRVVFLVYLLSGAVRWKVDLLRMYDTFITYRVTFYLRRTRAIFGMDVCKKPRGWGGPLVAAGRSREGGCFVRTSVGDCGTAG